MSRTIGAMALFVQVDKFVTLRLRLVCNAHQIVPVKSAALTDVAENVVHASMAKHAMLKLVIVVQSLAAVKLVAPMMAAVAIAQRLRVRQDKFVREADAVRLIVREEPAVGMDVTEAIQTVEHARMDRFAIQNQIIQVRAVRLIVLAKHAVAMGVEGYVVHVLLIVFVARMENVSRHDLPYLHLGIGGMLTVKII